MAKKPTDKKCAAALLHCLAKFGWQQCTPARVARQTGLSLQEAATALQPQNFCRRIAAHFTAAALEAYRHDAAGSRHDALFDVMMLRFDAMQNHRAAILDFTRAARRDPQCALALAQAIPAQMRRLLRAAGCHDALVPSLGLTAVYLAVFPVWARDTSSDCARTMAALDKNLRRAEWIRNKLPCTRASFPVQ